MEIMEIKKQVEESLNKGVTAVEDFHKKVALAPFDFFKNVSALEKQSLAAKKSHQEVIENIYKTIRDLNHRLSETVTELIKKVENKPTVAK